MKAKDTVMWEDSMLEKQAEISFKIGKTEGVAESLIPSLKAIEDSRKAGIKEVVDFLGEKLFDHNYSMYGHESLEDCFACRWEDKLKEWGVK